MFSTIKEATIGGKTVNPAVNRPYDNRAIADK